MNTNQPGFLHRELTQKIIGVFYDVYNELNYGFLESVYQESMVIALNSVGLQALSPVDVPVWFRGQRVGKFEGDVLVEKCVLLELKSARAHGQCASGSTA